METSLRKFRDEYLDLLLRFLWREWTALGVAGQDQAPIHHVIDPEALLLFTCSLGRYYQRLFDEVLDWLTLNGRFLNVQRMRNMTRQENLGGGYVLRAMADWLSQHDSPIKWKLLATTDLPDAKRQSLFFLRDGRPLPGSSQGDPIFGAHGLERNGVALRGYSKMFSSEAVPCFLLKLRALFGVNARCDALAYLTMNRTGHPREIAREMYYSQKAIHEVLTELAFSGFLQSVKLGRERTFRISSAGLPLLAGGDQTPRWINWPVLLSAADGAWKKIEELRTANLEPLVESAEVMLELKPLLQRLLQSPWAPPMSAIENQRGLALLHTLRDAFQALTA